MKRVAVAIVGASLAGAACLRELTRLGVEAVAFERERFPREKVCGGFLSPGAVSLLAQIGVLDQVRRAGAVDVKSARVRYGDAEVLLELPRSGLGISRRALDRIVGKHDGVEYETVREVRRNREDFGVCLDRGEVRARVVVDASGKLTRLGHLKAVDQFGVQFYAPDPSGDVLDFWFFAEGYGGAVSVEGGLSNWCFLIGKDALPRYLNKPGCRVTGPAAYRALASDYITVGDAAGMIDPFCGEGMRHALDSGRLAARAIAEGLAVGASYGSMRASYESDRRRRWAGKRRLSGVLREALKHPWFARAALPRVAGGLFRRLWG